MTQSSRPDVFLVNPGNPYQVYQALGESLAAVEPPVWAGLMHSFLTHHGVNAELLDANAEAISPQEVARRVKDANPRFVSIVVYGHQPSASTQNMPAAGVLARTIKELQPKMPVLMVGGHVAALSERTLNDESVDFVSSGEGLYTMLDLVEWFKAPSKSQSDLQKVRGLCYLEGGHMVSTPGAPLLKNLDQEMPGLPWDKLPMNKYRAHNWHCFGHLQREPYAALYTTLGCPYHCSFCCIQAPFRSGEKELGMKEGVNSYRFWSPEFIVNQIEHLVMHYGVRNIKIADEMFVLNMKHVMSICDLIIKRKLDLNIWAYARVDTVRDGMIEKLKEAGVNWLAFGIESGSARVRDAVQKGIEQEDIVQTLHKVRAAGINVIGNYIFGLPEDDLKSMQETLDLAIELNCEFGNFYCAMAYPGSPLYLRALSEKWQLPQKWSGYSQHSVDMLPLPTKYLTAAEVIRFRDDAFQTYFSHPRYLSMIRQKFGPDTERHIHEMTSYKLKRQHV